MEHTIVVKFTDEEEGMFNELCGLYAKYQESKGRAGYEYVEEDMLSLWIKQGLAGHLLENYSFMKAVLLENIGKGEAA